jgi:hypothetical protein
LEIKIEGCFSDVKKLAVQKIHWPALPVAGGFVPMLQKYPAAGMKGTHKKGIPQKLGVSASWREACAANLEPK